MQDATKYYTPTEAAQILRVSPKTLSKWRGNGDGPIFRKAGRKILYAAIDLEAFMEPHRSTKKAA